MDTYTTAANVTLTDSSRQTRFAELLDRHSGILRKVVGAWCRQLADRQDLAQEITTELWRAFPRYDAQRPFSTWMYRIALNVAISGARSGALRGGARGVTLSLDDPQASDALRSDDAYAGEEAARDIALLHSLIDRQPPLDRALLLLWLEDLSGREIAEVLGISESNVATKLSRLKQRLRVQLAGGLAGESGDRRGG